MSDLHLVVVNLSEDPLTIKAPYHYKFIALLKEAIPPEYRLWNPDKKVWEVDLNYWEEATEAVLEFFNSKNVSVVVSRLKDKKP